MYSFHNYKKLVSKTLDSKSQRRCRSTDQSISIPQALKSKHQEFYYLNNSKKNDGIYTQSVYTKKKMYVDNRIMEPTRSITNRLSKITKKMSNFKVELFQEKRKFEILNKYNNVTQKYYTQVSQQPSQQQRVIKYRNNQILIFCQDQTLFKPREISKNIRTIRYLTKYHPPNRKFIKQYLSSLKSLKDNPRKISQQ